MTEILVIVALIWLLVLTILFAGVVRHLGALQAVGEAGATPSGAGGIVLDTDGPWIPSPLPEVAHNALTDAGIQTRSFTALFFSAGCGRCLERASAITERGLVSDQTVVLITGSRAGAISDLRRILEPSNATIVLDPQAHDVVKSLDIQSTPFAFRVEVGQVTAKAYVRDAEDFEPIARLEQKPSASVAIADREGQR